MWLYRPLPAKWCLCLFNMLPGFVIAFLPRSKCFLNSWLPSSSTVTLEPKKIKSLIVSIPVSHRFHSPSICYEVMGPDAMIFFECWVLSQLVHSPLSPSTRGSLVPLHFLPLECYYLSIEVFDISPSNLDSSLWFIRPNISHDVLCIVVK